MASSSTSVRLQNANRTSEPSRSGWSLNAATGMAATPASSARRRHSSRASGWPSGAASAFRK